MLALHGHCSGGKVSVVGDRTLPEVAKVIDEFNYDYGLQLVRAGFIVFCPDARGMGERQSFYAGDFNLLAWECGEIQSRANPLGQTVAGMWTWDNMRLIDYIESRPDCLKGSVGAAGLSGGGLQTLYLAAMDKRVRCAVISGYFYTVKDSILQYSCCPCNIVPRLWEFFDMGDLAALIAPRPLLIETGTQDPLNGIGGHSEPARASRDCTKGLPGLPCRRPVGARYLRRRPSLARRAGHPLDAAVDDASQYKSGMK